MVSANFQKDRLLRTAETLTLAVGGAAVFSLIGFPAGLVSGSLLTVASAALLGRPMLVPLPLTRVVSVLVGMSLGAVVTPETLRGIVTFPLSIAVLTASTICMTAVQVTSLDTEPGRNSVRSGSTGARFPSSPPRNSITQH